MYCVDPAPEKEKMSYQHTPSHCLTKRWYKMLSKFKGLSGTNLYSVTDSCLNVLIGPILDRNTMFLSYQKDLRRWDHGNQKVKIIPHFNHFDSTAVMLSPSLLSSRGKLLQATNQPRNLFFRQLFLQEVGKQALNVQLVDRPRFLTLGLII